MVSGPLTNVVISRHCYLAMLMLNEKIHQILPIVMSGSSHHVNVNVSSQNPLLAPRSSTTNHIMNNCESSKSTDITEVYLNLCYWFKFTITFVTIDSYSTSDICCHHLILTLNLNPSVSQNILDTFLHQQFSIKINY